MWNYSDTSKLFNLAINFLPENTTIMKKIKEYGIAYDAHEKCTLICMWITENSDAEIVFENPKSYKPQIRKQFKWKIFNSKKVYKQSLRYLKEIWKQLHGFGELEIVMDKIRIGCIEVVWYIPTAGAQLLLNNIQKAASTFHGTDIAIVCLEGAVIFDCAGSQIASESVRFTLISELYIY